ncbi:xylose isomerase [Thermotoga sp. Ku-13t]|uniref:TIM barrel protein n=1 Tax=Thermotoga sp. Ku-13t TaxID=1755813 RepID=UPI0013EAADCD|nr:TIM barrel protein [Thermotoga sp. Ku-13t]KAF2957258.1 xylose isomerase [Thermotoga sp. Ku-13t]
MYPWHDTFHMGLIHFMAYPNAKNEEEILSTVNMVLVDEFFQAIEVSALVEEDTLKKIGKMCEVARVELLIAAQPLVLSKKLNLNSLDEEERKVAVQEIKKAIDKAYTANAKAIAFLSGRMPERDRLEMAKERLIDSLCEICTYAKERSAQYGYTLAVNLEVFDYSIEKNALVGPAPIAFEIASKVRAFHDNFGLTIDLSHQPLVFEDSFYTLGLLSPFVTHIHVGNAVLEPGHPAYGDQHPRFGIKGGKNDVDELTYFLKALHKIGYFDKKVATEKPVISFEVKPLADEDSDLVVANAKRTFLTAYAKFLKEV